LLVIVSFSFLVFTLKLWIGVYNIVILGTDGRTVSSCFFLLMFIGEMVRPLWTSPPRYPPSWLLRCIQWLVNKWAYNSIIKL
jgi:hypothetical protein